MKKYFEYIIRIIKEAKEVKKTLLENQKYLKPGKYKVNTAYKKIGYISSKDSLDFLEKNKFHLQRESGFFYRTKLIIRKSIESFFKVKIKNDNEYNASLLMLTNNDDLKLFNFEKQKIYNVFFDKIMYEKIKEAYNTFGDFFDVPLLKNIDEQQIITEKYIEFVPYQQLDEKEANNAIEKIFENYYNYFSSLDKNNIKWISIYELIEQLKKYSNNETKTLINKLIKKIPLKNYNDKFPIVKCNGDIVFYNILFNKNKYYFIDWEHYNNYIFFYDFFNIITLEAYTGNYKYLNYYFSGKYDEYFNKIFNIFNIDFNDKQYYLDLFVLFKSLYINSIENDKHVIIFLKWYIKI